MANAAALNVVVVANTTQATAALARMQTQLAATTKTANATTSTIGSKFASAARYAGAAAGGALAYGLYKGVKAGIDFEKQMDAVAAVSNATAKEQKKLEKQALDLGQATTFSANEVAAAQEELVKGGLKVRDVLGGALKSSLNLAAAGNIELAEASATVVNAMKLFELRAKDAGAVADMFATAANKTTADVADFAMALRMGGSAAKAVGYDLNDTVTILEALAEAGIKNSDAGTSMKTALLQLVAPTETQSALAEKLGLNLLTQNGELKNAAGLSSELQGALGGMSKSQVAANLKVLAGTDGFRTLLSLYDAGPQKLDALARANAKQGTAQEIAKQKMDNTAGSLEQLSGAFETLSIKMFQSAQSPIRGFIDALTVKLEAFTDIVTSKKLTTDEKISEVIELFTDSLSDAIPVVAKIAGQIGLALVKGIARAFWEGDILTKLFIGGAALKMFGGAGALASLGKTIGLRIAGPLGLVVAAGIEGLSQENKIDAALDQINRRVEKPAFALSNMFRVNPDIDTESLTNAITKYQTLGKVSEKAIWKWVESGKVTAAQGQRMITVLERVEKVGGDALIALGQSAKKAAGQVKDFTSKSADWLRDFADRGDAQMDKLGDVLKGPLVKALDRAGDKVKDFTTEGAKYLRNLAKDADNSASKFERSMKKVGNSVTAAASVVTHGLDIIIGNTNKALKGFGVKKVAISLAGAGAAASDVAGKQAGGIMVPGYGSGDTVPAMLEPGEVVINREAVRQMGGASKANKINKAFPRFQKGGEVQHFAPGGIVPIAGMPGEYIHQSIAGDVQSLISRYKLLITDGYAATGHSAAGEHPLGLAIDAVPGAGGSWDLVDQLAHWAEPAQNQPIPPFRWVGYDGDADHGRGDHIHLSWNAGETISGKMGGALADSVKRLLVKGPDGPIKDLAQASLDKVRNAANKYIQSKMPSGVSDDLSAVESGGPVVVQMGKYLRGNNFDRTGAAGIIGNAYRESLWDPGAVGTGGGGLFGFTTSPVSLADLQNYAAKKRTPWTDVETQMEFMLSAPGGGGLLSYGDLTSYLRTTKDLHGATYRFMNEWERPGIPAFEDRLAGAQKALAMNWQRGGIVGMMQEGGLVAGKPTAPAAGLPTPFGEIPPDRPAAGDEGGGIIPLTKVIKKLLAIGPTKGKAAEKYDDKKHDSDVIGKVRDRLRKLVTGKNYPTTPDGSELAGKVADMREEADKYSEWAGDASTIGGPFKGKTEVGWMREQLVALLKLRNLLIAAEKEMEKQAKRVRKLERDANKRLREFERKTRVGERLLGKKGKTPGDWDDKDEDPASIDVAKWNKLEAKKRKSLMGKFERHHGRLPGDRLFTGDAKLITPESQPGSFPNLAGWKTVAGFLKNTVVGTLKGSDGIEGAMDTTMATLKEELKTVAGTGSGMQRLKPADYVDKIGRFGGEILQTQTSIRDSEAAASEPLDIAGLRSVIEAARYGVFDNSMPRFHSGGIFHAPTGQSEGPALLQEGERVIPADQTATTVKAGDVNVVNTFSWEGFDLIVETEVNDQFHKREKIERHAARQY